MNVRVIIILLFCSVALIGLGQIVQRPHCYNTEYYDMLKQDPVFKKEYEESLRQHEIRLKQWRQSRSRNSMGARRTNGMIDTLTIVVHICLPPSKSNEITEAIIKRQIESLNEDFGNYTQDKKNTPPYFMPLRQEAFIRFALARTDVNLKETKGFIKYNTANPFTIATIENVKSKATGGADPWDVNKYINIWITEILPEKDGKSLLGKATFPWDNKSITGIMLDYRAFGKPALGRTIYQSANKGHTLTHEMGHFLGLSHIWADEPLCNKDDGIDDTPQQKEEHEGVPIFPEKTQLCDLNQESSMFMNYMDYTADEGTNMFSKQQVDEMEDAIEITPRIKSIKDYKRYQEIFIRYKNDLELSEIINPTPTFYCNEVSPKIQVRNYGSQTINSFKIRAYLNQQLQTEETWQGSLVSTAYTTVTLSKHFPINNSSTVNIELSMPNNINDDDMSNNTLSVPVKIVTPLNPIGLIFYDNKKPTIQKMTEAGWRFYNDQSKDWEIDNNNSVLVFTGQGGNAYVKDAYIASPVYHTNINDSISFEFSYAGLYKPNPAFTDTLSIYLRQPCLNHDTLIFQSYGVELGGMSTSTDYNAKFVFQTQDINLSPYLKYGSNSFQIVFKTNGGVNNVYMGDILFKSYPRVNTLTESDILVYYRPQSKQVVIRQIEINSKLERINIINTNGQLLRSMEINSLNNTNFIYIDINNSDIGTVFVQLEYTDRKITKPVLIY